MCERMYYSDSFKSSIGNTSALHRSAGTPPPTQPTSFSLDRLAYSQVQVQALFKKKLIHSLLNTAAFSQPPKSEGREDPFTELSHNEYLSHRTPKQRQNVQDKF